MKDKKFLVSFIEDDYLGVYVKEILVKAPTIKTGFNSAYSQFPTLKGIKEVQEVDEYRFSHEGQEELRRFELKMRGVKINENE